MITIEYLGESIAICVEHPEFRFKAPVIAFKTWNDFIAFRYMIEEFYQKHRIPEIFIKAFNENN
jgi:hypothetical protein